MTETWVETIERVERQPPLRVGPIHGVLPFDGARNPLSRSNSAQRVLMTCATPATKGKRKAMFFESAAEHAVALEALLSGQLYDLEVQLPPISYMSPHGRKREHYFDLRLTYHDGYRVAIFVRNDRSLKKADTWAEIDAIFAAMPTSFANEAIVVNANHYCRARRDNLRRLYEMSLHPDPETDARLLDCAAHCSFYFASDLIAQASLPGSLGMAGVLRLIGRGALGADLNAVITDHSRIWLVQ